MKITKKVATGFLALLVSSGASCRDQDNESKDSKSATSALNNESAGSGGAKLSEPSGGKESQRVLREPKSRKKLSNFVQPKIDAETAEKLAEKRTLIVGEAQKGIERVRSAIKALDKKKPKEALTNLEKATGKFELDLARDPGLAMAPIAIETKTYDVLTTLEAVASAKVLAREALAEDKLQLARILLNPLRSEEVISVTQVPLARFPSAIKAVAPLIDEGKFDEAKVLLIDTLETLVVTDHVIPLPLVRAHAMLEVAEKLAEEKKRTADQNGELKTSLENARYQLFLAKELGYGTKAEFAALLKEMDQVESKTKEGKSGTGFFDQIKSQINKLREKAYLLQ